MIIGHIEYINKYKIIEKWFIEHSIKNTPFDSNLLLSNISRAFNKLNHKISDKTSVNKF